MKSMRKLSVDKLVLEPKIVLEHEIVSVAIEMPIALIYNGISHIVMMALPKDLTHFAIGFSLSEGIIESLNEIYDIEIFEQKNGIEIQIEISTRRFEALKLQRRQLAGRTGCGLCGVEQLAQIKKPLVLLPSNQTFNLNYFLNANEKLLKAQEIGQFTHCTHAAIWLDENGNFIAGFEDIGRHVALDKLLGFRAQQTDKSGIILVSSRVSYEMVQKMIQCKAEVLLALSVATSFAVEIANEKNLTLIGLFKQNNPVIYSGKKRILC